MSKIQVIHSLVAKDGQYICMPPWKGGQSGWGNLSHPDVTYPGGDAQMLWPINTKFVDFDRTFIYGYCSTRSNTDIKANIGLFNYSKKEIVAVGAVAGAIGDKIIGVDGLDNDTAAVANAFAGGYFMPRVNPYSDYRIIESTAFDGGRTADEMDLTLSNGLTCALALDTANCYLDKNPYVAMRHQWYGSSRMQVVGVTLINSVTSTYQWVQTWGPCHMPSDEQMGSAASLQMGMFAIDGSIHSGTGGDWSTTHHLQVAGYAIGNTTDAMTWFIHLQLER